jgi:hypothetical protein
LFRRTSDFIDFGFKLIPSMKIASRRGPTGRKEEFCAMAIGGNPCCWILRRNCVCCKEAKKSPGETGGFCQA